MTFIADLSNQYFTNRDCSIGTESGRGIRLVTAAAKASHCDSRLVVDTLRVSQVIQTHIPVPNI